MRQRSTVVTMFEYDVSGAMTKTWRDFRYETILSRDGEGREAKRSSRNWDEPDDEEGEWEEWKTRYFIFSNVLGRNITEASETGKKRRTYVVAGGATIARQGIDEGGITEKVSWEHTAPGGFTVRNTGIGGSETSSTEERDALGNNVGLLSVPQAVNRPSITGGSSDPFTSEDSGAQEVDGILTPGWVVEAWANGSGLRQNTGLLDPDGFEVTAALDQRLGLDHVGILQIDPFNWNRGNDRNAQERTSWVGFGSPIPGGWGSSTEGPETPSIPEPPPPNPDDAIDKCLRQLFGVSLTSFKKTQKGVNGAVTVNFVNPDFRLNGLTGFGVVNNVVDYTMQEMRERINRGRRERGEQLLAANEIITGFTPPSDPLTNYTASGQSALTTFKTQVHELGHTVHRMMKRVDPNHPDKEEAGQELEDCVSRNGGFR